MRMVRPTPDEAYHTLRAMKTIALADGELDETERHLLRAVQRVFETDHGVEEIRTVAPEELAREIPGGRARRQLVLGLLAMSMIDREVVPEESALLDRMARGLGIPEREARAMRASLEEELAILGADALRRFWASERSRSAWSEGALAKIVGGLGGAPEDAGLAARYRALEREREGSLGRGYWEYCARNGFALPGEPGAGPELLVAHDLAHVLSGYGTDPEGEVLLACFQAGARGKDPLGSALLVLLQYHLGVHLPRSGSALPSFGDAATADAFRRGRALRLDLRSWDYWPAMPEALDALRRRYGLAPPAAPR